MKGIQKAGKKAVFRIQIPSDSYNVAGSGFILGSAEKNREKLAFKLTMSFIPYIEKIKNKKILILVSLTR